VLVTDCDGVAVAVAGGVIVGVSVCDSEVETVVVHDTVCDAVTVAEALMVVDVVMEVL